MKYTSISLFVLVCGLLIACSAASGAEPVTIENAGFEDPVLGDSLFVDDIPGWNAYSGGWPGVWNVEAGEYALEAPEGSNVGWLWESGAGTGANQVLSGATGLFELDADYSMDFFVGHANSYGNPGYQVQLLAGGTVLAQDDNSMTLTQGVFSAGSFSYSYNAAHSALVGQPLEVRLLTKGLGSGDREIELDAVAMTATYAHPVPFAGDGAYRVVTGTGSLSLDATGSLPSDGAGITAYDWDFNSDGSYELSGALPGAISYADLIGTYGLSDGANTVNLRVTDDSVDETVRSWDIDLSPATTTYTGANSTKNESWNIAANWDNDVPVGPIDAVILANKSVTVLSAGTPVYTGDLTINENATLQIGYIKETHFAQAINALGTPGSSTIHMYGGSMINNRLPGTLTVPAIELHGDVTVRLGSSTNAPGSFSFDHGVNGAHTLTIEGKNECNAYLTTANTFDELIADPGAGNNFDIFANAAGSLGIGDVTILAHANGTVSANLIINALDAMSDTGTLSLNGSASLTKLTVNFNDTIGKLYVDGLLQNTGSYGKIGNGGVDFEVDWLAGDGILTIAPVPSAYWDINGSAFASGGPDATGTWDDTTTNWNGLADGSDTTTAWTPGVTAVFAASSDAVGTYTVTVDGAQDINGVSVEEGNVTLVSGTDGSLNMTADSVLSAASGATGTISTPISDNGTPWSMTKTGDGRIVLSGANTYTGVTRIEGGTLSVSSLANAGVASNIGQFSTAGAGGLVIVSGSLEYTGASVTVDRGFTLKGNAAIDISTPGTVLTLGDSESSGGNGTLTVTGAAGSSLALGQIKLVEGAGITLNPTAEAMTVASVLGSNSYGVPSATLTLGGTATGNVITGNITRENPPGSGYFVATVNIVKSDTGTWTLAGTNSANGSTTINGGVLLINGACNGTGTTVNSGGTLGGSGTVAKNVTVQAGGAIAPGSGGIGTLTVNAQLTWASDDAAAGMLFDLSETDDTSDLLVLSGALTKGSGSSFIFDFVGGTGNTTYTLANFAGTSFLQSDFAALPEGIGGEFVVNATDLQYVTEAPSLRWDGTFDENWADDHWSYGGIGAVEAPIANEPMAVSSGRAIVSTGMTATPAASLKIARFAQGGTVEIDAGGSLAVTGPVEVRNGGTLNVNGSLTTSTLRVDNGATLNVAGTADMKVSDQAAIGDNVVATIDAPENAFNVSGADVLTARTLTLNGGTMTLEGEFTDVGIGAGLSYIPIHNDADSGIDSGKTYTHAVDFANRAGTTVNGVVFDRNISNGSTSIPREHGGDYNADIPDGEAVRELFRDMRYDDSTAEIILNGLTPGQWYDFRLYNRSWGNGGSRTQDFLYDVGNDGSTEDSVTLNADDPVADPPGLDVWNRAYAMAYVYQATASGELKISINTVSGGTYHNYGLTNEETIVSSTTTMNLAGTTIATTANSTVTIADSDILVLGGVAPGAGTTLTVGSSATDIQLTNLTLGGGSQLESTAAAGGADVTITVGGTLAGGDGVSSVGEFFVDPGWTNLTLAADSTYEQTFTFDGLSSELNGESVDMVEGNRIDVWGSLTLGDDVTIRLVDNGGSADGEDVVLFRAAFGIAISTYSIELPDDWASGGLLVDAPNGLLILQNLVTVAGPLPGDANNNGTVGDADWVIFKAQFGGAPGGVDDDADFNNDGRVDLRDLSILDAAWDGGVGAPEMDATVTPEPATMSLLAIGGLLVLRRRRRKA